MTKDIDDLLLERFTVGFSFSDAQVLRALAHKRRVPVSDLIRAATMQHLDAILPDAHRLVVPTAKRRSS